MNKRIETISSEIGDSIALEIQSLRQNGKISDDQPLIKVNFQKEALHAPFQYDIANGVLHRPDCPIIKDVHRSAFYGVWQPANKDFKLSCKKCMPVPIEDKQMEKDSKSLDIVFGFLSFIDQFSSVFIERGQEYRKSERGRQISKSVDKLITGLDQQQKEGLNLVLNSLNGLIGALQGINEELNPENSAIKSKSKRSSMERKTRRRKNLDKEAKLQ